MSEVSAFARQVNPSVDDAITWLEKKAASGEVGKSSARLAVTALRQITSVLQDEEPMNAGEVLASIDDLGRRWQNLNPDKKGDTARTYIVRARTALENYAAWRSDPTGFRFPKRERAKATPASSEPKKRAPAAATAAYAAPPAVRGPSRSFPLTGSGEFQFTLPEEGLRVKDVMRIACHLLTLAEDFDPTLPTQAQFFSLAKREEQ